MKLRRRRGGKRGRGCSSHAIRKLDLQYNAGGRRLQLEAAFPSESILHDSPLPGGMQQQPYTLFWDFFLGVTLIIACFMRNPSLTHRRHSTCWSPFLPAFHPSLSFAGRRIVALFPEAMPGIPGSSKKRRRRRTVA